MSKIAIFWMLICVCSTTSAFAQSDFRNQRFVDLRDLAKYYDKNQPNLHSTANALMSFMRTNPELFTGDSSIQFFQKGAEGPSGKVDEATNTFVPDIDSAPPIHLENSILIAQFEDIVATNDDRTFSVKLLLFINNHGFYEFRRYNMIIDWMNSTDPLQFISIVDQFPQPKILLGDTNFSVHIDLSERKAIFEDLGNSDHSQIDIVIPLGVGSFDSKPDGSAKLMTDEFPRESGAKLRKYTTTSTWGVPNDLHRFYPADYMGRPFITIFKNGNQWDEIGMHYRMAQSDITRGFISHGCIRVRDNDLYVLSAIVNDGPRDSVDIEVAYSLPQYQQIDNPMTKENFYQQAVYKKANSSNAPEKSPACPNNLGFYNYHYNAGYRTLADQACLTMLRPSPNDFASFMNFLKGKSQTPPSALVLNDIDDFAEGDLMDATPGTPSSGSTASVSTTPIAPQKAPTQCLLGFINCGPTAAVAPSTAKKAGARPACGPFRWFDCDSASPTPPVSVPASCNGNLPNHPGGHATNDQYKAYAEGVVRAFVCKQKNCDGGFGLGKPSTETCDYYQSQIDRYNAFLAKFSQN